ncbi:major facilitator superfamily domain-containing protein [Nemania sp. FL0916]|nr:major facilitator superfamily domain-containing protein [Nemania sp. FL0916]
MYSDSIQCMRDKRPPPKANSIAHRHVGHLYRPRLVLHMQDAESMEKTSNTTTADGSRPAERELVTWDGPEDENNPKNWAKMRKWRTTISVSAFVLLNTLSSTIVAPALPQIARDLHVTSDAEELFLLSIFVLGFAFGPLLACPLSEVHGRKITLLLWNVLYLAFNTACGAVYSSAALLVLRFLAGFFCSASQGIGGGFVSDLFTAKERGRAIAVYSIMPLIGPVIGPVLGGVIAQYTSWRWTFYAASLLDAVILLPSLFTVEETHEPVLLRKEMRRREKETGREFYTEYDYLEASPKEVYSVALIRPLKLLGTQPIVQVMAVYNAFLYGLVYILYANFPALWTDVYHETPTIASLNYLSIFVGSAFAAELATHAIDRLHRNLTAKHEGVAFPEFRIPVMPPATIVLAAGMFLYGWGAQFELHWIVPNVGAAIFAAGVFVCAIAVNLYMVDTYGKYAASALAAISTLRQIFGAIFPIFAPYLYCDLGYGWGSSVLGFLALAIGLPAVLLLWKYGKALRRRSPYAQERATTR